MPSRPSDTTSSARPFGARSSVALENPALSGLNVTTRATFLPSAFNRTSQVWASLETPHSEDSSGPFVGAPYLSHPPIPTQTSELASVPVNVLDKVWLLSLWARDK
jgi:hypothetical protein